MRVYEFFKKPNPQEDASRLSIEEKYVLYAITNNTEYAQIFQETRNMKKFILHTHKNIDKEEYAELCNQHRGAVLELYENILTCVDPIRVGKNMICCNVLMTYFEHQIIVDAVTEMDNEDIWATMPNPAIFSNKIVKALNDLLYISYYKLYAGTFLDEAELEKLNQISDDDYSMPNVTADELHVFMKCADGIDI